jgi:filamentous hemagglutinin family protein
LKKQWNRELRDTLRWAIATFALGSGMLSLPSLAQVRPDETTATQRFGNCATRCEIRGGVRGDRNLFHSFQRFSIPEGGEVYFAHPNRVRNLFVRVTGRQASILEGLLFAEGRANVFLMNPNGILLSDTANINVGGSFTATTADAIAFNPIGVFAAQPARSRETPTAPQLLTVDPSAFLFHRPPAPITVAAGTPNLDRLQVFGSNTLLFLGGDLTLDNAFIAGAGGTSVQLMGLAEAGRVDLSMRSPHFDLHRPDAIALADITLQNGTQIDVRTFGRGEIRLTGRNVTLDNTVLLAGRDLSFDGPQPSPGNIMLTATETLTLDRGSIVANNLSAEAFGNSGNIRITAQNFIMAGGSQIDTSTFGVGSAGNVRIEVGDRLDLHGVSADGQFATAILSNANPEALGNGGNIVIRANQLWITEGAQLSTGTDTEGNAGNIRIRARERVVLDGSSPNSPYASIAFSNVTFSGLGNGGNIRIQTGDLSVTNGASLVTSTDGIGDAGRIVIRAEGTATFSGTALLNLEEGTIRINSGVFNRVEPFGIGDAGNIRIQAQRLIVAADARLTSATLGLGNAGDIFLRTRESILIENAQVRTDVGRDVLGRGGTIVVATEQLTLRDRGQLVSASEGTEPAGDIYLNARDIWIDASGVIAATLSQDGGNLTIANAALLVLRNNALLATTAGLAGQGGNGGNIEIEADLIVAVPRENSNISADAFEGNGGNVDIVTQGLFGIEFRDRPTPLSDITASSQFGLDGEVSISNPAVDPTTGIVELPTNVVDAATRLRRDCAPYQGRSPRQGISTQSEFVVTGRGGLPVSPHEMGSSSSIQAPWVMPPELWGAADPSVEAEVGFTGDREGRSLLGEAQAWQQDDQGRVVLTLC